MSLYYGAVPGHKPGDIINPPDGDVLYATSFRVYGKLQAAMLGGGNLYRVTPVGHFELSDEDTIPTIAADRLQIESVVDKYCRITPSEYRRIQRLWLTEHQNLKAQGKKAVR